MPGLLDENSNFDVNGARNAGYSDAEIADQLGSLTSRFDLAGARKAGFGDDEIIETITTGKGFDRSTGALGTVARGAVSGLASTIGAVLDLATFASPAGALMRSRGRSFSDLVREIPRQISGALTGNEDIVTYESVDKLPPSMRPFAYGGELIGGSLPFAFAPVAIAKSGVQLAGRGLVSREIGRILDFARKNPRSFLALEASSIFGGAVAGGLAEATFPGETFVRLGAEVVGSVLNPTALVGSGLSKGRAAVRSLIRSRTAGGQKQAAADYLSAVVEQFGDDPVALAQAIKHGDSMGLELSPGLRTGSKALLGIEQELAKESAQLNNTLTKEVENALGAFRRAADTLASTGDPNNLAKAVEIEKNYFTTVIDGLKTQAERKVSEARARIGDAVPGARETASRDMFDALDTAMRKSREVEKELWGKIPKNVQMDVSRTLAAAEKGGAEILLPTEGLPGEVGDYVRTIQKIAGALQEEVDPEKIAKLQGALAKLTTSGNVAKLRSRALEEAREFRSQKKFAFARLMDEIADGALEDLGQLEGGAVDVARTFSREFNDNFTRTFAGRAFDTEKTGAQRISPEQLLNRAFRASEGSEAGERFADFRRAAAFAGKEVGDDFVTPVVGAQERFMQAAAREVVDPSTGKASPEKLQAFIDKHNDVLSQPEMTRLREALSDLGTAERELRNSTLLQGTLTKRMRSIDAFARLGNSEEPVRAITMMMRGKSAISDFKAMATLARRNGEGAVNGMRAAVIDYAMREATSGGQMSFNRLAETIAKPIARGQPTLIRLMRDNGLLDKGMTARLLLLTRRGRAIENRAAARVGFDEPLALPNQLEDFLLRVAGSKMGRIVAAAEGRSESLIAAAAGSKFLRSTLQDVPLGRTRDLLYKAVADPELMAELLTKGKAAAIQREVTARRVHSVLMRDGLVPQGEPEDN